MNKQQIARDLLGFCQKLFSETLDYLRRRLFFLLCILIFLALFINTFLVYNWCYIDSETYLLSCGSDFMNTFFNFFTAHVLYQTIYTYNEVLDTYSYLRLFSLVASISISGMFIVGFLVLSFGIFNIPFRFFALIKEKYFSGMNAVGEVNSDQNS